MSSYSDKLITINYNLKTTYLQIIKIWYIKYVWIFAKNLSLKGNDEKDNF